MSRSGGELAAESSAKPERVPWRRRQLGEGLEPGAVRLEVLPLGVELLGELLPLDLEAGDAVCFGFEAFEGGGGGCFGAGVGGAEVGELAVCVLEAGEVLADEGGQAGGVGCRWWRLSWAGSRLAVVGAAVGCLQALEGAGGGAMADRALGDSEVGGEAGRGLPVVRVVGWGLVDDLGCGVAHGPRVARSVRLASFDVGRSRRAGCCWVAGLPLAVMRGRGSMHLRWPRGAWVALEVRGAG